MSHSDHAGFFIDTDGVRLLGTIFLAPGDDPKPTALLLHGIPGIEKNYDLADILPRQGWNAVIFHYRGCWGSSGAYNITTIPRDVRAVVDWLVSGQVPQVDPEKLIVIGHSLGGWAAVISAANDPRLKAVAALGAISEPEEFPLADPAHAATYTPWLSGVTPEQLASQWAGIDEQLTPTKRVHCIAPRPLLIIHGSADESVALRHAQQLYKASNKKAVYVEIPDANHSFTNCRGALRLSLRQWLAAVYKILQFSENGVEYRPLKAAEIPAAAALLTETGLPLDGFPEDTAVVLGAFTGDRLCGCAALEIYGPHALLRSVAVTPSLQRNSLGKELTRSALIHAAARNVQQVFLLTETADSFFTRLGFSRVPRSQVPSSVQESIEFTSACPQSAIAMTRQIIIFGD